MFGLLLMTFGVALGSAILPLITVEVFVIGLVASQPTLPWVGIGIATALGQMLGKLVYYLAARGSIRLPEFLHKRQQRDRLVTPRRQRWQARTKWLRSKLEIIRERCHRHPFWMNGTYGVSALTGIPPFMATTVLAGLAQMPIAVFLSVGLAGRFIRFSALAAFPTAIAGWVGF